MTSALIALAVGNIILGGGLVATSLLIRSMGKDVSSAVKKAADADARLMIQRENTERATKELAAKQAELDDTILRYTEVVENLIAEGKTNEVAHDPDSFSRDVFWLFEKRKARGDAEAAKDAEEVSEGGTPTSPDNSPNA